MAASRHKMIDDVTTSRTMNIYVLTISVYFLLFRCSDVSRFQQTVADSIDTARRNATRLDSFVGVVSPGGFGTTTFPVRYLRLTRPSSGLRGLKKPTGNESVPKVILNDTINLFFF